MNNDFNLERVSDVPASPGTTMPAQTIADNGENTSEKAKSDNVHVAIRVRPLNARERAVANEFRYSWHINQSTITQMHSNKPIAANSYTFDNIFQPPSDNAAIFQTVASNVVRSAVDGINGVIFAYGQTAAGKTHTMLGSPDDRGVTPRSISAVFEQVAATPSRQFLIRATYIEIYNEVIRDLLMPANDNLRIHEDVINKRIFVDAKEVVVSSVDQVMQIIAVGEEVRAVGETNMNDRSSRSHTIFSLKIESREMNASDARDRRRTQAIQAGQDLDDFDSDQESDDTANDGYAIRCSTLSLVDLAGSERASFTKAQGMRLVEGGHINKSLLTLGNVINKLSSGESRSLSHIPYRDSKLTRLLQTALGGNARTAIICAVTPSMLHMEETLSTLKFASRAMKVTNSAKTNEFLDDRAKLRQAEKLIATLRAQLQSVGSPGKGIRAIPARFSDSPSNRRDRIQKFEGKFERLLNALIQSKSKPGNPVSPTASPVRKRLRTSEVNRLSALHLMRPEKFQSNDRKSHGQPSIIGSGPSVTMFEKEVADLRGRAFEAEKNMRQILNEVQYEREAMANEVSELVAAIEETSRQRDAAERECGEAFSAVAHATAKSLVDEVVSEAMSTSELRKDLRTARKEITSLSSVLGENKTLQGKLTDIQRENAELARRDRRGVGPVLKDCRQAQAKLSEAEVKLRSAKQAANVASAEKSRLERELKLRDRTIKSLTAKVEQQQKRDDSRLQAKIAREVGEAQKVAAAEAATLNQNIEDLASKLAGTVQEKDDLSSQLHETKSRLIALTQEYDTVRDSCQKLEDLVKTTSDALSSLQEDHATLDTKLSEANRQIGNIEQAKSELEHELSRCRSDLESKFVEILKVDEENATLLMKCSAMSQRSEILEKELRDYKKNNEEMAAQASASFADASQWEARAGMERSQRECEKNLREQVEQENERLRERIEHLEDKMRKAELRVEESVRQTTEAERAAATLRGEILAAESWNRDAKNENSRLQKDIVELSVRHGEVEDALKIAKGEAVTAKRTLEEEIAKIERKAADEVEKVENARIYAENKAKEAEARIAKLEEELFTSQNAAKDHELLFEEMRGKLRCSNDRLAEAEGEVRRQALETEGIRGRMEEAERLAKDIEEHASLKIEEQRQEICRLLEEDVVRNRELRDACSKISMRDKRIFELDARVESICRGEGEVGQLRERVERRTRTIRDLTQQLSVMRRRLQQESNLDEEALANVYRLAEAEGSIKALTDENQVLKKRVAASEEETVKCKALVRRTQEKWVDHTAKKFERISASNQEALQRYRLSAQEPLSAMSRAKLSPSTGEVLRDHSTNLNPNTNSDEQMANR